LDLLWTFNKDKEKTFIQNTENICRILEKHVDFQGRFRFDAFKNKFEIFDKEKWRDIEDVDSIRIQTRISILFPVFSKIGKEMVYDAIIAISKRNTIDSAVDYLTSLHWDGSARLDTWLTSVYKSPIDVYHKAVAANWLKGLVKRIIEPGCKFDYVLVLFGPQGIKKSTSLSILVGHDWHLETVGSPDHKDFFDQFRGKVIIEFSEGETLSKTDVKKLKAVVTMQSDTYRPPYGRFPVDFPRRCVFAMTTNQDEFLKDDTGNRRWLPVECSVDANIEWLQANREQLLAEAYHRVINLKETTWEFPVEETRQAQEDRRIKDPNTDIIAEWYAQLPEIDRLQGISIHRVYKEVLNGNMPGHKPMSKYEQMQIGEVLRLGLRLDKRQVMRFKVRTMLWFRQGDETPTTFEMTQAEKRESDFSNF
jgi:putative DNA primase/helicase